MYLSLKWKLTLIIVGSLLLPVSILGSIWYISANRTIENNAADYGRALVEQSNQYLDAYLSELDRIAVPFLLNSSIQDFMHLSASDHYRQFALRKQIRKELYANLFSTRPDIEQFILILNNDTAPFHSLDYSGTKIRSYDYYLELLEQEGGSSAFTIEGLNRDQAGYVVTAYKIFQDPLDPMIRGILVVDLNLSKFAEIAAGLRFKQEGQAYLIDSYNRYIYHPSRDRIGTFADIHQASVLDHGIPPGDTFVHYTDNQMQIYQTAPLTGWTLLFELPLQSLTFNLLKIRTGAVITFLVIAALILILLGGFSYRLIRSLSFVQQLMKRVEIGDLKVRAPETRGDEVGKLLISFNRMVSEQERLKEVEHAAHLKEKEMQVQQRESKIMVLQSQINPHFLYNTLGTIQSYAIVEGVEPISRMASNLATLFRYSMEDDEQLVSLWDEIRYIRTYIDIQQVRFEQLQVEIELADEAMLRQIPCTRLMFQPLIENALQHGYEDYDRTPDYVGIYGLWREGNYEVQVIDRGGGMEPAIRDHYQHLFDNLTLAEMLSKKEGALPGSIGLWNVHQRIKLIFGEAYGLKILESTSSGTTIAIRLPGNETGR